MESQQEQQNHHQQQQQNQLPNDDGGSGKSSLMCSQSSTRWTPTTEQIRILKDFYYNNGVRSPSNDQIQKISAKLRQYGKIDDKNIYFWFQNHKARERKKKRLTSDIPMQRSGPWRPEESFYTAKYPNITTGNFSIPLVLLLPDCSISTGFNGGNGPMSNNFSWVGANPTYPSPYPFLDKKVSGYVEEEEEEEKAPGIETLPLFPMHGEDISDFSSRNTQQPNCYYPTSWYQYSNGNIACSQASLELSLN